LTSEEGVNELRLVSIVINNYNYARFLREAIDSALAQTHPHCEVIVVDDGSTDDSWAVIEEYAGRIIPVRKANGGQASAFNAGFAHCGGEIVIFLDADDRLLPSAAHAAVKRLEDSAVVRVHWPLCEIDETGRPTGRLYPPHPLAEGDLSATVLANGPISYVNAPTSGNAWRRSFLEQVLPVRDCGDKHGGDAYLFTLSPFFGLLGKIDTPQSCYRVHAGNYSGHTILSKVRRDVRRYDHHCRVLEDHLRGKGVAVDPEKWKGPNTSYAWMQHLLRATEEVEALLPPGASFILVDENQWGGKDFLPGRRIVPFTERAGEYGGPPKDDAAAIAELERLRRQGASFIVFTAAASWWLDYYAGFVEHLSRHFRRVAASDCVVVFDLRTPPDGAAAAGTRTHFVHEAWALANRDHTPGRPR
jgi:glycosyltransferase involved in cell wall biosynthesis